MKYYLVGVGDKAVLNQKVCETQDEAQQAKRESKEYFQLGT